MTPKRDLLSKYIKEKRIEREMTQNELASKLGYTAQFVANWERGVSSPPGHALKKLVSVLKIPAQELVDVMTEQSAAHWREVILGRSSSRKRG